MTRLLLVDDNESIRVALAAVLEEEGYVVETAASFHEAERAVASEPDFALALLDRHLGDRLGTDLVPIIQDHSPATKLVILTGSEGDDTLPGDVDGYLQKGGDVDELLGALRRILRRGVFQ